MAHRLSAVQELGLRGIRVANDQAAKAAIKRCNSPEQIDGLPAVHLKTYASPMAYAYDEYYLIQNDRLFRISIIHCGQEDWELYDQFLAGFQFPHAP